MSNAPIYPKHIFYAGYIWELGYSNYFGNGYTKLSNSLRKHPKHQFIAQMQVLGMLRSSKCSVVTNPRPSEQIIDDTPYCEWLKTNKQ